MLARVKAWISGQLGKRVTIDTMIVDLIDADPEARLAILKAGERGFLVFVQNHVVRDQITAIPQLERRERLLALYASLPVSNVPSHGFVLGVSRLGEATLGDGCESGVSLGDVRTRGRGALHDALIATTASGQADVLVTEETDLRRKVESSTARCQVWSFSDLKAYAVAYGSEAPRP